MNPMNLTLLVVDDNRLNRMKLSRALGKGGFETAEAAGGQEAIEMLRSGTYGLVLLDLVMPEVDGLQVLTRMQGDAELSKIPVIVVSAVEDQNEVQRCLSLGAVDFIAKTAPPEELLERVQNSLASVNQKT